MPSHQTGRSDQQSTGSQNTSPAKRCMVRIKRRPKIWRINRWSSICFENQIFASIATSRFRRRRISDKGNDLLGNWETSKAVKSGKECQTCHMPEQVGESANGENKRKVAEPYVPRAYR